MARHTIPFPQQSFDDAMGMWVLLIRSVSRYTTVGELPLCAPSNGMRVSVAARRARALLVQVLHHICVDPATARGWLRMVLNYSDQTVTRLLEYELAAGEVEAVLAIMMNGFKERSGGEWVRCAQAERWF